MGHAPPDGRVIHRLAATGKRAVRLGHHPRGAGHAFDAPGHHDIAFTGTNGVEGAVHGLQRRAAQPVHRGPGHAGRKPSQQQRHACHVAVVLPRLVGRPHLHIVNHRRIDAGPLHSRSQHQRREVVGAHRRQAPPAAAHRRAGRRHHKNVLQALGHPLPSFPSAPLCLAPLSPAVAAPWPPRLGLRCPRPPACLARSPAADLPRERSDPPTWRRASSTPSRRGAPSSASHSKGPRG